MNNQHRTNLKEAYKFVKTCRLCKKQYGVDSEKERDKDICPVCYAGNKYGYLRKLWRME